MQRATYNKRLLQQPETYQPTTAGKEADYFNAELSIATSYHTPPKTVTCCYARRYVNGCHVQPTHLKIFVHAQQSVNNPSTNLHCCSLVKTLAAICCMFYGSYNSSLRRELSKCDDALLTSTCSKTADDDLTRFNGAAKLFFFWRLINVRVSIMKRFYVLNFISKSVSEIYFTFELKRALRENTSWERAVKMS